MLNILGPAHGSCLKPFESGGSLCATCRHKPAVAGIRRCSQLIAESAEMQQLLAKASTVASTDASVVIRGESGSGKEVVARALHANSARAPKPFVAINCAALPAELLESELFGHTRGAFTGAHGSRKGLFEVADGGTLFLDEIAEMPLALQAKLLRALQDGEIRRVGESEPFRVDVRIICATHQDLRLGVTEKRFREDLYFRLKVFSLFVPPLRNRREDIPVLAELFLEKESHATCRFTAEAVARMLSYAWPGNVRELANAVKHGAVLSKNADVDVRHLPDELQDVGDFALPARAPQATDQMSLAEAERLHILKVLESCGGQQIEAARVLGIGRTTLWRKLKHFGIDV